MEAGTGDEVLESLAAGSTEAALILTDIRMPGATGGIKLAEGVSASDARLPVIMVSGDPGIAVLSDRYLFLLKPFAMDKMVEAVLAALPATPMTLTAAAPEPSDGTATAAPDRPA